jgi:hypothetical protein
VLDQHFRIPLGVVPSDVRAEMSEKAQFPELEQIATRTYSILETVGDYLSRRNANLKLVRLATLDIVSKDDPLTIGHHVFSIFIAGLDHQT